LDSSDVPESWVKLLEKYVLNIKVWGGSFGSGVPDPTSDHVILTNIARMLFYCNPATLKTYSVKDRDVGSILPSEAEVNESVVPDPLGGKGTCSVVNIVQKKKFHRKQSYSLRKKKKNISAEAECAATADDNVSQGIATAIAGGEDYPDSSEMSKSS
jgi:hypothetical protein